MLVTASARRAWRSSMTPRTNVSGTRMAIVIAATIRIFTHRRMALPPLETAGSFAPVCVRTAGRRCGECEARGPSGRRQSDPGKRAAAIAVAQPRAAVVELGHFSHEGQADAAAAPAVAGARQRIEAIEDLVQGEVRDARAVVGDLDQDAAILRAQRDRYR